MPRARRHRHLARADGDQPPGPAGDPYRHPLPAPAGAGHRPGAAALRRRGADRRRRHAAGRARPRPQPRGDRGDRVQPALQLVGRAVPRRGADHLRLPARQARPDRRPGRSAGSPPAMSPRTRAFLVLGDGALRRRAGAGDKVQTLAICGNLRLCVSRTAAGRRRRDELDPRLLARAAGAAAARLSRSARARDGRILPRGLGAARARSPRTGALTAKLAEVADGQRLPAPGRRLRRDLRRVRRRQGPPQLQPAAADGGDDPRRRPAARW